MTPEPTNRVSPDPGDACDDGDPRADAHEDPEGAHADCDAIKDDEPADPEIRQLDIDAAECIRTRDFKTMSTLLPKIIAVVGQCPEVVMLMFWCAEDANSTDALQTVSQLASCYSGFRAPHIHRVAATALANAGRYEEALEICKKHHLLAESEVIRRMCARTLEKMGLHDEAKKYRTGHALCTDERAAVESAATADRID